MSIQEEIKASYEEFMWGFSPYMIKVTDEHIIAWCLAEVEKQLKKQCITCINYKNETM